MGKNINAVIHLDVPEYQIGQEVMVYFKDTMSKKGTCECKAVKPKTESAIYDKGYWWYVCGECNKAIDYRDNFCRHCGKALIWENDQLKYKER